MVSKLHISRSGRSKIQMHETFFHSNQDLEVWQDYYAHSCR